MNRILRLLGWVISMTVIAWKFGNGYSVLFFGITMYLESFYDEAVKR